MSLLPAFGRDRDWYGVPVVRDKPFESTAASAPAAFD